MVVQEAQQLSETMNTSERVGTERHMQKWKVTDEYPKSEQVLNHAVTDEYSKVSMSFTELLPKQQTVIKCENNNDGVMCSIIK